MADELLPINGALAEIRISNDARRQMDAYRAAHMTQVLTILMTDLERSTRQQSDFGNVRAYELTRTHRELFRQLLKEFDAEEVETAGDSFLIVFAAPSEAVRFALYMQARMREARLSEPSLAHVRVGIHQGQVVVERHAASSAVGGKALDIYGLQVSMTARIMDLGRGDQILCSRSVFDDARAILRGEALSGLEQVEWSNHGSYRFAGVPDPCEVCEMGEAKRAPLEKPPGSAKSHPVDAGDIIYGWRPGPEAMVPHSQWRLERKLGEGGFGEVWLAQDKSQPARKVVFKFCTRLSQVKSLRREKDVYDHMVDEEGRTVPGVAHVLSAHDDGEGGGPPYFIQLAYYPGGDLRKWIEDNGHSAPVRMKLDIALQMTRALERIHDRGFVHRDVKPSNYLVDAWPDTTRAPDLKLSDFGIGQEVLREAIAQGRDTGSLPGGGGHFNLHSETLSQAAGTFLFIAPELIVRQESTPRRLAHQASSKADIYSLGVSLYQLFAGNANAVPGPGLKDLRDPILREDVEACLDSDPEVRPNARELTERLERYDVRVADRAAAAERERQRLRNRRLKMAAGVVLLIAGFSLAFGGVAVWQWGVANHQRVIADIKKGEAEAKTIEAETQRKEASMRLVELAEHQGRMWYSDRDDPVRALFYFAKAAEARRDAGIDIAAAALWVQQLAGRMPLNPLIYWDGVKALSISPDCSLAVAVTENEESRDEARLYDVSTGRPVGVPIDPEEEIETVEISLDNKWLLVKSPYGVANVWDIGTGKPVGRQISLDSPITEASFSPNGKRVLIHTEDNAICVWDAGAGEPLMEPIKCDGYPSARFSPDSTCILIQTMQAGQILDATTGNAVGVPFVVETGEFDIWQSRFSPDGRTVLTVVSTGSSPGEREARLWDSASGLPLGKSFASNLPIETATYSPNSQLIATYNNDTTHIWNAGTGELVSTPRLNEKEGRFLAFSLDGKRVLANVSGIACVFDSYTGTEISLFSPLGPAGSFCPFGNTVLIHGNHEVGTWDVDTGIPLARYVTNDGYVDSARFSPDGAHIITTGRNTDQSNMAFVWDAHTPSLVKHSAYINSVEFSPDERWIVTASQDNTCRVWDVATGQSVGDSLRHDRSVTGAEFSPDGRNIVTSTHTGFGLIARVWKTPNGTAHVDPLLNMGEIETASFSPDSKRLLTFSRDSVQIWNAATGAEVGRPIKRDLVRGYFAGFSIDGKRLFTVSDDERVCVWDVDTLSIVSDRIHDKHIECATFSSDGKLVLTASLDGTVCVWSADTGAPVSQFTLDGVFDVVRFSPGGNFVLTSSPDSAPRVWKPDTGALVMQLQVGVSVLSVLFSTDESRLFTHSPRTLTAELWDLRTTRLRGETMKLDDIVHQAAFSMDGKWIITANSSGAQLWDASTGFAVGEYMSLDIGCKSASFSPDGRWVAVISRDTGRIWPVGATIDELPDWLPRTPEALTGMRLVGAERLDPIPHDEYLELRDEWFAEVRAAAMAGDEAAQFVIRRWNPELGGRWTGQSSERGQE